MLWRIALSLKEYSVFCNKKQLFPWVLVIVYLFTFLNLVTQDLQILNETRLFVLWDSVCLKTCENWQNTNFRYTWLLNGAVKSSNQASGKLTFAATTDNAGYYECHAKNQWGTAISNSVLMISAFINTFTDAVRTKPIVQSGFSTRLDCRGRPTSAPAAVITWSQLPTDQTTSNTGTQVHLDNRIQIDQTTGIMWPASLYCIMYLVSHNIVAL